MQGDRKLARPARAATPTATRIGPLVATLAKVAPITSTDLGGDLAHHRLERASYHGPEGDGGQPPIPVDDKRRWDARRSDCEAHGELARGIKDIGVGRPVVPDERGRVVAPVTGVHTEERHL